MTSSRKSRPRSRLRRRMMYGLAAGMAIGLVVGTVLLPGTASAASLRATYAKVSTWGAGYTAQYTLANTGVDTVHGWNLAFELPAGARVTSMWEGRFSVSGTHVTVRNESWNADLAPGRSVVVGFVVDTAKGSGEPSGCKVNGSSCDAAPAPAPVVTGRPTKKPTPVPTTTRPTAKPTTAPPVKPPAPVPAARGRFAPYVDTLLFPPYDLLDTARKTGVKDFTLAFVVSSGGCTPSWGGVVPLAGNDVARQLGALRAAGGDAAVSFGGATGTELATACSSPAALADAYGRAVSLFKLTRADFDIEGAALGNTAANDRRAKAIALLQRRNPGLLVSFTLPVLPQGLTQAGVDLVRNAKANGVAIDAVNIMAMDYGAGAAPNPQGRMGDLAIDAANATQRQIKGVLGVGDAEAFRRLAVTPMIGVNDVSEEVFTVADARKVAAFARAKGLSWTAMWSATRDKACPGGPKRTADATCSSLSQQPLDFTKAFRG